MHRSDNRIHGVYENMGKGVLVASNDIMSVSYCPLTKRCLCTSSESAGEKLAHANQYEWLWGRAGNINLHSHEAAHSIQGVSL